MLTDRVKTIAAACDQLVRVALMPGVEHELIARGVENVVQREGQLDDAEVAAEVTADFRNDVDDAVADLLRELRQLAAIELAKIGRRINMFE